MVSRSLHREKQERPGKKKVGRMFRLRMMRLKAECL